MISLGEPFHRCAPASSSTMPGRALPTSAECQTRCGARSRDHLIDQIGAQLSDHVEPDEATRW